MSKQRFKQHQPQSALQLTAEGHLPTDQPIAVYYRQSSDVQVGNISTAIQTVDMVAHLKQRGWAEGDIYLIDMDAGVSGTKRIDERPGMRKLFELIVGQKIKAVACQDEDRLFRDVTQIQVNIFIEACRGANVLVITPSMIYDFANEHTGQFHARQFRFKSEMAAEYLTSFVLGRLHRAKKRLALEGRWTSGSVPPGFMVDMRKTLPDGSKNEQWRHYVPFEPYADVINAYFRLFLETGGCVRATLRRIHDEGVHYPDPAICTPPVGFALKHVFQRHGDSYFPGKTGLYHILTNVAYIGHWCVNDVVVRWNNHPAIVPTDIFFKAFNYLSERAPDGSANSQYRPSRQYARVLTDQERPAERPLLAGMMVSQVDGEWRNVGTEYVKCGEHYRYMLLKRDVLDDYVWSKNADWIDEAVVRLLHEKLRITFNSDVWQQSIATFEQTYLKERKLRNAQLSALEQAVKNLIGSVETLSNPDMIRAVEKRYEDAKAEHSRLSNELAAADMQASHMTLVTQLKDTYETTISDWGKMTHDEKRVILHAFVDHVEAVPFEKHGLHVFVCWRDGSRDKASIPRLPCFGDAWSLEEHERLEKLLDGHATQEEIAASFPKRTWRVIRDRIARTRGMKTALFTPKPVRDFETYEDFLKRLDSNPNARMKAGHTWRKDEIAHLLAMLEGGATKMEIAQAFPYRTWTHLRAKISQLKGTGFEIPGDKPLRQKESYAMYQQRLAEKEEENPSCSVESNMDDDQSSIKIAFYSRCSCWTARRPG
ncbi:MAG: recombinase family protein [Aggregatilineales bacterium]